MFYQAFTNCCYAYTKICAWYWFICVKTFESGSLPRRPLGLKKIKTASTVFFISKTIVLNPYSNGAIFDPQFSYPFLNLHVCWIDMSQSDIQILYSLQIDNGIRQCVNSRWTGIFKNKFIVCGQYIGFATLLLISIYQKC